MKKKRRFYDTGLSEKLLYTVFRRLSKALHTARLKATTGGGHEDEAAACWCALPVERCQAV